MDFFPEAASTIASDVDTLFLILHLIAAAATAGAFFAIGVAILRGGKENGSRREDRGDWSRGVVITLVLTTVVYGWIGLYSEDLWGEMTARPTGVADTIRIAPRQFQWDVSYAGADGRFSTDDDPRYVNRVVIPKGRPVRIEMRSTDVIHSFFVPAFRIKRDAVPGTTSIIYVEAIKIGTYELVCTEYCGLGHYRMRGVIEVVAPEEYVRWIDSVRIAVSATITSR